MYHCNSEKPLVDINICIMSYQNFLQMKKSLFHLKLALRNKCMISFT